jgi:methanethiol oxidase
LDHDTVDVVDPWELDRGDRFFGYDGWWHLNHDTVITSSWAHLGPGSGWGVG